jgi:DNA-binding response OmpR family regulator
MGKILVVDDNDNTLKLIASILSKHGHMTVNCLEPRDAIEKLKGEVFDLLITDVMMPGGITGFDFVKTLRAQPEFKTIPIIFVTGRREKRDIEKGIQSGADDYVIKPIDPEILVSKVSSLLLKKTKQSDTFVPGLVKASATWDMSLEIVQITEAGLEIQSALPAPVGHKVRLNSTFFAEVGIPSPFLRVVSCEPRPENGSFAISLHFMGLTEKELTPIRLWIRSSKVSKRTG